MPDFLLQSCISLVASLVDAWVNFPPLLPQALECLALEFSAVCILKDGLWYGIFGLWTVMAIALVNTGY